MKRKHTRLATGLLAAFMLVGCGSSAVEAPYVLPEWAQAIAEPELGSMENITAAAKVDVYYDNTQSMYGFANEGSGGQMILVAGALRNIIDQYSNATVYTLDGTQGSLLQWTPYTGDLYSGMSTKEFYTYNKGSLTAGVGPLQMLYYQDNALDPTAINVVVTDLAEQNVDTGDLAAKINENILSQEGYSATLIGIQAMFTGRKYPADPESPNAQLEGQDIAGERLPIYILITGPDAALGVFVTNLTTQFKEFGLVEDTDFFIASYHAGNSARVLERDDIITVDPAQEQDGMRKDDWNTAVINQNLALSRIDDTYMDTLIDTDKTNLNLFAYRYDKDANGINTGRTVLNYFVPIQRTDGLDLPIYTKIYQQDEKVDTKQLQELYESKDKIRCAELVAQDAAEETLENWLASDSSITGEYAVNNEDGEPGIFIGWKDIKQISYEKDMQISTEVIVKGTPVYDMLMEADGRDIADFYQGTDLGLASESDLLHIVIEFDREPEERSSDTVLLDIPVYAMAESVENIPDWIGAWNSASSGDYIYHTFGLENFFRTLFGLNVLGDATYNQSLREVKIAEILTCVTGLPD